jgi:hypothetical protein
MFLFALSFKLTEKNCLNYKEQCWLGIAIYEHVCVSVCVYGGGGGCLNVKWLLFLYDLN